jgi:NDP-sugar pyrophosphorylase family protein
MSLPVAILAGGLATRLGAIAERIPKSLVDVGGRPFAVHQIELLRSRGISDITFLIGHLGDQIQRALGDGARFGVRIRYALDGPRRLGTAGALRHSLPLLADPFFVMYGDSYLECDFAAVADAFAASGKPALMTVYRNENRWDRSNVLFSGGAIARYNKARRTTDMHHIDYGLGAFRHSAFDRVATGEEVDLASVYEDLLAHGDLAGFEVDTRFYEVGSVAGLQETSAYLAQKDAALR